MKGFPKNLILIILLSVSISFLIACVSASDPSTINNNYVFTSYSADNSHYVKSTSDNQVYYFDSGKNAVPWTYNIGSYIGSIAISPDGSHVAVGCGGGLIYLFDQQGNVLWKKSFGNSLISPISFSEDGNDVDASNALNQAFYINLDGDLAVRPEITDAIPTPSEPLPSTPDTQIPANYLPGIVDTTGISWSGYIGWGIIALIILWILWVNISNRKKKGSQVKYPPPPQNGMIYAESIPSGAKIYIDGTYVGVSPVTIPNVWLGSHSLKATLNGYDSNVQRITINAGQTALYSPTLRKLTPPPPNPPTRVPHPAQQQKLSIPDLITQLGAKTPQDREEAQKQLIIKVNTEGKPAIQQIIKELEKQPSGIKREIVNLLYYLSKESHEGQKATEELILALTYSSPEVKWLIIQTLGRLKDKRALSALEAAVLDTDFLVKYWAIISLKSIQES